MKEHEIKQIFDALPENLTKEEAKRQFSRSLYQKAFAQAFLAYPQKDTTEVLKVFVAESAKIYNGKDYLSELEIIIEAYKAEITQ